MHKTGHLRCILSAWMVKYGGFWEIYPIQSRSSYRKEMVGDLYLNDSPAYSVYLWSSFMPSTLKPSRLEHCQPDNASQVGLFPSPAWGNKGLNVGPSACRPGALSPSSSLCLDSNRFSRLPPKQIQGKGEADYGDIWSDGPTLRSGHITIAGAIERGSLKSRALGPGIYFIKAKTAVTLILPWHEISQAIAYFIQHYIMQ